MKKTIIITGASSGLGAELAKKYSLCGHKLFLFARSSQKLHIIETICKQNGAEVISIICDIIDTDSMENNLKKIIDSNDIDIVIACAGVSAGTLNGPETTNQVKKIFATNLYGTLNTILPVIPSMIKRKTGNIVIISSMAGIVGLSSAPSYSASKGAIRLFGEAMSGYLKTYNVNVTTVIPGYIDTPMTKVNRFPMPLMLSARAAAEKIISGIEENKNIIAFPLIVYFFVKLFSMLPSALLAYINSKLPGKPSFEEE